MFSLENHPDLAEAFSAVTDLALPLGFILLLTGVSVAMAILDVMRGD